MNAPENPNNPALVGDAGNPYAPNSATAMHATALPPQESAEDVLGPAKMDFTSVGLATLGALVS